MDITGIPPHTTLVYKIEILKLIIEALKVSVTRDMKGLLKDKLNAREIGVPGFVQENPIFPSLMKSSLTIRSQQNRALVKEKSIFYISLKTEFLLRTTLCSFLRKKRYNYYCGAGSAIGEFQNPFISAMT